MSIFRVYSILKGKYDELTISIFFMGVSSHVSIHFLSCINVSFWKSQLRELRRAALKTKTAVRLCRTTSWTVTCTGKLAFVRIGG